MRQKQEDLPLVNEKIRFDKMQLIGPTGSNEGIVSRKDALSLAREANLDLVIIAASGTMGVPVAKILDFGKMLYEKKKRKAEAKKKQQIIQIKEVKLRPKIAEHDYQTKMNQAVKFLREGKHLKLTLMFRGREMSMKYDLGRVLFDRVDTTFESVDFGSGVMLCKDDSKPMGNAWSRVYYLKNK